MVRDGKVKLFISVSRRLKVDIEKFAEILAPFHRDFIRDKFAPIEKVIKPCSSFSNFLYNILQQVYDDVHFTVTIGDFNEIVEKFDKFKIK